MRLTAFHCLMPFAAIFPAESRQFHTNRIAGEQCWVDNYISNDRQLFLGKRYLRSI